MLFILLRRLRAALKYVFTIAPLVDDGDGMRPQGRGTFKIIAAPLFLGIVLYNTYPLLGVLMSHFQPWWLAMIVFLGTCTIITMLLVWIVLRVLDLVNTRNNS